MAWGDSAWGEFAWGESGPGGGTGRVNDVGTSDDVVSLVRVVFAAIVDTGTSDDEVIGIFHNMVGQVLDVGTSEDVVHPKVNYQPGQGRIVRCIDIYTGKIVQFKKADREGLKWSSAVNGGDYQASWRQPCGVVDQIGFAPFRSRVEIVDTERNKVNFNGILDRPMPVWEGPKLTRVEYLARGVADAEHREFPDSTTFGAADLGSFTFQQPHVSTGVHIITDLKDIMQFALTIAPDVNGTQSNIATTGMTLSADTGDFRGQNAASLWSTVCALTAILGTPYIWLIEPDASGLASLVFKAAPSSPEYFENGTAKEKSLAIDGAEIANQIYITFNGNETIRLPIAGDPLDYSATPDIQTHMVDLTENVPSHDEAELFAQGMYAKFNQRRPVDGSITLDKPLRAQYIGVGTPEIIPHEETRAGHVIRVSLTKTPYFDITEDVLIMRAEHDEDSCTTTLSPSSLSQMGKEARFLSMIASRKGFQWSLLSGMLPGPPEPPKPEVFVALTLDQLAEQDPNQPGADLPSVFPGIRGTAMIGGDVKVPDGIPTPIGVTGPPVPATTPPLIRMLSGIPAAITDVEHTWFGQLGGQIHPDALPNHRVINPAMLPMLDPITSELTDGERASLDLIESWVDRITARVLGGTPTSVEIHVDIWSWELGVVRQTDAFVFSLDGEAEKVIDLERSGMVYLYHGDHAIYRVVGPVDDVLISVALSGWKHWKEFPVLIGPDRIPGNA